MKKIIVSIVAIAALSTGAFATNSTSGCGLGSMIIKGGSDKGSHIFQSIFNSISFNQAFGVSSGTSNCKSAGHAMNERTQDFVASNMDQLAKEIAVGHGESVDTLAELLNVQDKEAFASALQANYNGIYTSDKSEMSDVLDNISAM